MLWSSKICDFEECQQNTVSAFNFLLRKNNLFLCTLLKQYNSQIESDKVYSSHRILILHEETRVYNFCWSILQFREICITLGFLGCKNSFNKVDRSLQQLVVQIDVIYVYMYLYIIERKFCTSFPKWGKHLYLKLFAQNYSEIFLSLFLSPRYKWIFMKDLILFISFINFQAYLFNKV